MKPASELPTRVLAATEDPAATLPGSSTSILRPPTLPPACAPPRAPQQPAVVPAWYLRSDGAFRC